MQQEQPRKKRRKNFLLTYDELQMISPLGQGGNLKGEVEMVARGLDFLLKVRQKFANSEKLLFTELQLLKLQKECGITNPYGSFLSSYELNCEKRRYSLKYVADPTPTDVYFIYRRFRNHENSYVKVRKDKMPAEKLEEIRQRRMTYRSKDSHRKRKREWHHLAKITKHRRFSPEPNSSFNFEIKRAYPKLLSYCKTLAKGNFLELSHDTIVKAYQIRRRYTLGSNMSAWLIGIAIQLNKGRIDEFIKKLKREVLIPSMDYDHYHDVNDDDYASALMPDIIKIDKSIGGRIKPAEIDEEVEEIGSSDLSEETDVTESEVTVKTEDIIHEVDEVEEAERSTDGDVILNCIEELPDHFKNFLKVYLGGDPKKILSGEHESLSYREMADKLGYDELYVKTKMRMLRVKLAKEIMKRSNIRIHGSSGIAYTKDTKF